MAQADYRQELLNAVRDTVRAIEPEAEIILYGSRARGDAQPDSDWDLLVLLPGKVDWPRERRTREAVIDVELEKGEVLSSMVMSRDVWANERTAHTPWHDAVLEEGIKIA